MNRVLVTGGGGFVGKAIIHLLLQKKVECTVLARNRYIELEDLGVRSILGDITNRSEVVSHLQGFDGVFHVAALAGIWGNAKTFYDINVLGTQNIIDGCVENGIPILVHTSTPSVVFDRGDIEEGDERLPYPQRFLCSYAKTKAEAERRVLAVGQSELKTCAIRPHLVWGPGDPHLIPRLLERGRQGKLQRVGKGENLVDISYIDNVAHAHVLAAFNLTSTAEAAGKAYFIAQERPVELWKWIDDLFTRLDIPPIRRSVSLPTALVAGGILEGIYSVLRLKKEPLMTRFLAEQLARSHYFSHENARRDFGYSPRISIEEGMERLVHWLKS